MAGNGILDSIVMPSYQTDSQDIDRRAAMAQALMGQAMTPQQGQMVSGHYIAPAFGGLDRLVYAGLANKMNGQVSSDRMALNKQRSAALAAALNPQLQPQMTPVSAGTDIPQTGGGWQGMWPASGAGTTPPGSPPSGGMQPVSTPPGSPAQASQPQPAAFPNQGAGGFTLPNMLRASAIEEVGGPQAASAYWKQYEPTELQRNDTYLSIDPRMSRESELAKRTKEGTQSFQPNQMNVLPNGQIVVAPDFSKGTAGGFDAKGRPVMGVIQGAPDALYRTGLAQSMASEDAKAPISVPTPGGNFAMTPGQYRAYAQHGGALQSDAGKTFETTAGADYGKYLNEVNSSVNELGNLNQRNQIALQALDQFKSGGGAPSRMQAAKIAQAFNLPDSWVNKVAGGDLASMQMFEKMANQQAMETLRAAVGNNTINRTEWQAFSEKNPNIDTDPEAIRKIAAFYNDQLKRKMEEQRFQQNYVQGGGNPIFGQTAWQQEALKRGYINPNMGTAPQQSVPARVVNFGDLK